MEKIKRTLRGIFEYNATANGYISRDPKHKGTHLAVAINKVSVPITKGMKVYNKLIKKWNKKMDDLRTDYAATDSDGVLLFEMIDTGNEKIREYKYKPAKYKELGAKLIELEEQREEELDIFLDEETIEFIPRYTVHVPANLTEWEKEIFSGIIINPEMLKKQEIDCNGENGKSNKPESELLEFKNK